MPAPTYLVKDRHGAFLFRIKIPTHLCPLFSGKKVITKSLKTYHRPTALKLARSYASKAYDLFCQLEMKSTYILNQTILKGRLSLEKNERRNLEDKLSPEALRLLGQEGAESSVEIDQLIDNHDAVNRKIQNLGDAIHELDRKIKIADELELRNSVMQDYGITARQLNSTSDNSPALSDAMLMYIADKEKGGSAKKAHPDKAKHKGPADSPYRGYSASFRLLLAAAGNIKTSELGLPQINEFKSLVGEMKNANHGAVKPLLKFDYKSHMFTKPLSEVLEELAKIDTSKLSQKTIEEYYSEISIFIGWLGLENEHLAVETCHRIQKALSPLKVPKSPEHAKQTNFKQYTIDQLQKLLTHPSINPAVTVEESLRRRPFTPADFWIPLLGLFTGARGREIAQLFTDDIYEEDGIWCISIKPEESTDGTDGKEVKTEASKRLVPIHQRLIDIGLLQFHREQKLQKEKHLFPQLRETQTGKDNPYKSWGQDFRRSVIQKHLGIPTKSGEVFHSFRGTLITELERQGVDEAPRKKLAGHTKGSDAHARYSGGETLVSLQTLINRATYEGLDFTHISWEKYKTMRLT